MSWWWHHGKFLTFDIRRVEGQFCWRPVAYQPWSYSGNGTKTTFSLTETEPNKSTIKQTSKIKSSSTMHLRWFCGWRVPAVQLPVNCRTTEMIIKIYLIKDELVMMGIRPRAFFHLLRRMSAKGVHLLAPSLNGGTWISIIVILLIWLLELAMPSLQKFSLLATRIKWSDSIWAI